MRGLSVSEMGQGRKILEMQALPFFIREASSISKVSTGSSSAGTYAALYNIKLSY